MQITAAAPSKDLDLLESHAWRGMLHIDGWRPAAGGLLDVVEPATGQVIAQIGKANAEDVSAAAAGAARAQRAWSTKPIAERADILVAAAEHLEADVENLSPWVIREGGCIASKANLEVLESARYLRQSAKMAQDPVTKVLPDFEGRSSVAHRAPLGVVGVIAPFNFPAILSIRAIAPALMAGNAVVLKPDPRTPIAGGVMLVRALEAAGLPAGLLQLIPGGRDVGEALCTDPNIAMIAFTGSTLAGQAIGRTAGGALKKVQLELGGKNSLIVLEDADVQIAASNAAWGAFLHQGQICMASGRILVHEAIALGFTTELARRAKALPVGDPMMGNVALGPLIDQHQAIRVQSIVSDSIAAGAKLEAGGGCDGVFHQATVLSGVRPGMRAFEEEFFGPVAAITTFADEEEAVALANAGDYGLVGAVISGSADHAARVGERLRVGHLHINDQTVVAHAAAPFGGFGASGNGGRISGPADWDEFSTWRWVTRKPAATPYPF